MRLAKLLSLSALILGPFLPRPAIAQEVTGVSGSPSATTTIPGNQLPPPPPAFGGEIEESSKDSTAWWPPRVVPPKGAPTVLQVLVNRRLCYRSRKFLPLGAGTDRLIAGVEFIGDNGRATASRCGPPVSSWLASRRNKKDVQFCSDFPGAVFRSVKS